MIAINNVEAFRLIVKNYIEMNSKNKLAKESGVSRQTIIRLLQDDRYDPGFDTVLKLCYGMQLDIPFLDLVSEKNEMENHEAMKFFIQYLNLPEEKKLRIAGYMDCLSER